MNIQQFREKYPMESVVLSTGKEFEYRYFKNPHATQTLVLLTGGIGLSDLFYLHFDRFARDFSVLTFDYQLPYANQAEFAAAVGELLEKLDEKVWLVGQSLGGIVAQVLAKTVPDRVEGMVLSNTCTLAADMSSDARDHLYAMLASTVKSRKLLNRIPFPIYKRLVRAVVMKKKTAGFTAKEKDLMGGLCDVMLEMLTKPYELHMLDFLADAENHMDMTRSDFSRWKNRTLLLLSEDDTTFNQACKDALITVMNQPTVRTDLTGGHLALLIRLDRYAAVVTDYIQKRPKKSRKLSISSY